MDQISVVYNEDCMDVMARYPDKYFDIAITDPPYGIGDKFKGGNTGKMNFNQVVEKQWDKVPAQEYWQQLFRISKNQIMWGGNYFNLPPTRCFIVWDKLISEDFSLAMAEMAWTSFDSLAKIIRLPTPKTGGKIHPTQKPIALYDWLIVNYAKDCKNILDTHVGSGSSRISAQKHGKDFIGCEIDAEYWQAQENRFKRFVAQGVLF